MTDRIGELYDAHAARLYAYARRRLDDALHAKPAALRAATGEGLS